MSWLACAICFGSNHNPNVALVMMGMLALPFLMVGGMFTFLYLKGVFATRPVEDGS
jgi:hypothetical protein